MRQKMRIWQTDTAKVGEHGGRCNGWIDWQKDMGKKAGRRKERQRGRTFMAPDFFYTLAGIRLELPDDVRESVFGVIEESLKVVLPVSC